LTGQRGNLKKSKRLQVKITSHRRYQSPGNAVHQLESGEHLDFKEAGYMSLSFCPSTIRLLILSCVLSSSAFILIAKPSLAQSPQDSSSSRCSQTKTLPDYENDLKAHPRSSLANYCEGELLLALGGYQASVTAYRASLAGDGDATWTKVWSHIEVGKIFDLTGQRERAVDQYQQALRTGDNTGNAMELARDLLQHPFEQSMNR
jgi:tetratricopeptide (TPR) repeat protein